MIVALALPSQSPAATVRAAAAGAEWRLASDLWLEAAFGTSLGTRAAAGHLFTLATLKRALGDRPRCALP